MIDKAKMVWKRLDKKRVAMVIGAVVVVIVILKVI
tara:strand:+ start:870 stop:974 length:105 start_codon:yes stop_codon:yes gene_type:complete